MTDLAAALRAALGVLNRRVPFPGGTLVACNILEADEAAELVTRALASLEGRGAPLVTKTYLRREADNDSQLKEANDG